MSQGRESEREREIVCVRERVTGNKCYLQNLTMIFWLKKKLKLTSDIKFILPPYLSNLFRLKDSWLVVSNLAKWSRVVKFDLEPSLGVEQ